MRRVFADASMLIAASGSRTGASRAVLLLAEIGLLELVVSRQVLDECERNLRRKLPAALPVFAALLAAASVEVTADPDGETIARCASSIAAKDAPILAAAVLSGADRLLTLDTRDFTPRAGEAVGITIQTPAQFVTALREWIDTAP